MAMAHHGDNEQSELMKRFREQAEGKAKREWPDGRMSGDDDGALVFKCGATEDGQVMLDFGKPVAWMAMPPQQAIEVAQSLIKQARSVSKEPLRVVL